jgi:hypothetical protein
MAGHLEITASTWHRWRNQYGGMKAHDAKKFKELDREKVRLKRNCCLLSRIVDHRSVAGPPP